MQAVLDARLMHACRNSFSDGLSGKPTPLRAIWGSGGRQRMSLRQELGTHPRSWGVQPGRGAFRGPSPALLPRAPCRPLSMASSSCTSLAAPTGLLRTTSSFLAVLVPNLPPLPLFLPLTLLHSLAYNIPDSLPSFALNRQAVYSFTK